MQIRALAVMLLALTLSGIALDALAQNGDQADAEIVREPERCLRVNRIRRTEIIDDQTIVFYQRGGGVFVNSLPRHCPQLKRNDRFMYEVRSGELCEIDVITVLDRFGGSFSRGFTCRLGMFHPSSADAVALLEEAAETGGASSAVTATPVELPEAADEDSDEAASGGAPGSESADE